MEIDHGLDSTQQGSLVPALRQAGGTRGLGIPLDAAWPSPCHLPTECMLRLLDCVSGTAQDFEGHDDSVHLCRFTPSGKLLFTAAHNEILVWEVTSP